jgi:hypothetical protein
MDAGADNAVYSSLNLRAELAETLRHGQNHHHETGHPRWRKAVSGGSLGAACATDHVARGGRAGVDRGSRQCHGGMMKWEYRVEPIILGDVNIAQTTLNDWGADSWEVIAVIPKATGKGETSTAVVLKRPLVALK